MRSGERFPGWMRQAENQFFSGLTLLLFVTFLCGGRFSPERPIVRPGALVSNRRLESAAQVGITALRRTVSAKPSES